MAIKKLDKSFAPPTKEIRYLSKTFTQFNQNLIDFARVYFPNTYGDFSDTSPGTMFIQMAAYIGDVLSYYIDNQFKESMLLYTEEPENLITIAQSLGFKAKPTAASFVNLDLYQLCPAGNITQNFDPDPRYFLLLDAGTLVSSPQYNVTFRTVQQTDFSNPTNQVITVYATNNSGQPLTYLVKKTVQVVAGEIKTFTATFADAVKFSTITLSDANVIDVISVVDSNGYTWNEVDYLAQDLILTPIVNSSPTLAANQSLPPAYTLQLTQNARRFVTRYNSSWQLELMFGSGILDEFNATINLDPSKLATSEYIQNLASTTLDPSDFLSSQSYGLAPSNCSMIITYSVGGGITSNVPSNSITKINTVNVLNNTNVFSAAELPLFNNVVTSLAINNAVPATGGKDADSNEEIRQNALAFFNAQNRLVNAEDYAARAYAMPPKYGSLAKAYVIQDSQINSVLSANLSAPPSGSYVNDQLGQNMINMYVLGYDQNKNLTILNQDIKNNLATYLDTYRILTDQINILDAFPISIGINFSIVVYSNYNISEVLTRCINALSDFFDIDKWQINQPIIINDAINTVAIIDGVQSVSNFEFFNTYASVYGSQYSPYIYDLASATTNGVIYPSLDPSIFYIVNFNNDIIGTGTQ